MSMNSCYLYLSSKTQSHAFVLKCQCDWLSEAAAEVEQQGIHSTLLLSSGHSAPSPAIIKHYSEHETIRVHSVYLLNKATLGRREAQDPFSLTAQITVTVTKKLEKKKNDKTPINKPQQLESNTTKLRMS